MLGMGGGGRLPVGPVRRRRRLPADAAADLLGHSAGGRRSPPAPTRSSPPRPRARSRYWRRGTIDFKLATVLLAGGIVGTALGVLRLRRAAPRRPARPHRLALLRRPSSARSAALMLVESVRAIINARARPAGAARRPGQHNWVHGLPFKMRFKSSRLYVSVIPIIVLGVVHRLPGDAARHRRRLHHGAGADLPAARADQRGHRHLAVPDRLATMAVATVLHAAPNQSVDVMLALILMVGGVIGAQFGAARRPEPPRRPAARPARPAGHRRGGALPHRTGRDARRALFAGAAPREAGRERGIAALALAVRSLAAGGPARGREADRGAVDAGGDDQLQLHRRRR